MLHLPRHVTFVLLHFNLSNVFLDFCLRPRQCTFATGVVVNIFCYQSNFSLFLFRGNHREQFLRLQVTYYAICDCLFYSLGFLSVNLCNPYTNASNTQKPSNTFLMINCNILLCFPLSHGVYKQAIIGDFDTNFTLT